MVSKMLSLLFELTLLIASPNDLGLWQASSIGNSGPPCLVLLPFYDFIIEKKVF